MKKLIVIALLFLAGLVFAQENKLLFKGVSLNDNPQTVLSNLQKVGFKIKSSKYYPASKYVDRPFTSVELVGPYFKWNDCKITLEIVNGKVMRLDVHDFGDELFKALVTKYGRPRRDGYIFKWTGFVDGEIWRRPESDFNPFVTITFFTIHKFRQDQQKKQQENEQYRKWSENL